MVQVEQGLAQGDFLSQNLCIAQSNDPEIGRFFADPGALGARGPPQDPAPQLQTSRF